ncbi:MAG TPA: xanthine dehydrogenase family protein subunit M [Myxococcales bacterium]|nr:xanthine dehydrogenase family protein subunit M [Myxococcales bacterium]
MYPAPFEYHAPKTVAEAVALLGDFQDDAKVIAGSQSLVPMMKLRLVQPKHVIDLRKVPGLTGISEADGALVIGALTTHRAIESSEIIRSRIPMLAEAASGIGDAQVRNLGTIGGSLSHADPAADWPAATSALDAALRIAGPRGERNVPVEQFITGPLTTTLEPNEIVIQVRVPLPGARSGSAYEKLPHPASRFAIVGAAAALTLDSRGSVQRARITLTGLSSKVARAARVEKALEGTAPNPAALKSAAEKAAEGLELRADATGSADYKAHLAAVYTERALRRAAARAVEG